MTVRLATAGKSGAWRAQLRDGRHVLADCGHTHPNRNSGGANAHQCGERLIRTARETDGYFAQQFTDASVYAAAHARRAGAQITDAEAHAKAETTLDTWRTVVVGNDFHLPANWSQRNSGWTCGCCRPVEAPKQYACTVCGSLSRRTGLCDRHQP